MKSQPLSIDVLTIDADTQARVSIHEDTVEEYVEIIGSNGKAWPLGPLDVFHDGSRYMVADGFHRTLAAQKAKRASIPCRVHKGTARDARVFGMTANDQHGLRMTRADKRACVEWLIEHGGKMTQAKIAEMAGVTTRTVQNVLAAQKAKISPVQTSSSESETSGGEGLTGGTGERATQDPPDEGDTSDDGEIAADPPNTDEPSTASIVLDALEIPVPEAFRDAHELSITLQSIGRDCDKFRQKAKELAEQSGGEWLRLQEIDEHVRALKGLFQGSRYHTICKCGGKGCQKCEQNGFLPDYLKATI